MDWYKTAMGVFNGKRGDKVRVKSKFPYEQLKSSEGDYYYVAQDDSTFYVYPYPPTFNHYKGDSYQIQKSLYDLEKI